MQCSVSFLRLLLLRSQSLLLPFTFHPFPFSSPHLPFLSVLWLASHLHGYNSEAFGWNKQCQSVVLSSKSLGIFHCAVHPKYGDWIDDNWLSSMHLSGEERENLKMKTACPQSVAKGSCINRWLPWGGRCATGFF